MEGRIIISRAWASHYSSLLFSLLFVRESRSPKGVRLRLTVDFNEEGQSLVLKRTHLLPILDDWKRPKDLMTEKFLFPSTSS